METDQAPRAYPLSPIVAPRPPVGQPVQLSRFDSDEKIVSGLAGLINRQPGAIRLAIPVDMSFRAVYLFLEAVPTVAANDFELDAEIVFRRNGVGIHSLPAAIGSNTNNAGTVTQTRLTMFANVTVGTIEALYATLSSPAAGGSSAVALTPNKMEIEADECWLNIRGSSEQANSFATWRALLAVRSAKIPL